MLSQCRRRQAVERRRCRQPDRIGDAARDSDGGVFDFHDQASRQRLRISKRFAHRLNCGSGNLGLGQSLQPGGGRTLFEDLLHGGNQFVAVLNP